MRKFIVGIVLSLALVLTACGGATEGTVYDKHYEQAQDWTTQEAQYSYGCTGSGSSQNCAPRLIGFFPQYHHIDECYKVEFKDATGKKGSACVAPSEYDSIQVGDHFEK